MTEGVTCGEHWSQHKKDLPTVRHHQQTVVDYPYSMIVLLIELQ
jgi:hypothetical protein